MDVHKRPSVASLFSGCGGLDIGFENAGFNIVFANDIEPSVKASYENYLKKPILIKDIAKIDKSSEIPDCDVLLAGIPCQPFSNAGKRGSMSDDRGALFTHVIEILCLKQPRVVLFENVRGFLSSKDDCGNLMIDRLSNELSECGYRTIFKLVNSLEYGVPQKRFRVLIIGVRKDVAVEHGAFDFPTPLPMSDDLRVGHIINLALPDGEQQECWALSPQALHLTQFIPPGGSWKAVPYDELPDRLKRIRDDMKKYHSPNFFRKYAEHEVMGTITASATPEMSGILHPHESRRYSVREVARFQSFPDKYAFVGCSISKKYKMIGNAVPPQLAYMVASKIMETYFKDVF